MSFHLASLFVAGALDTLTYWSLAFLIASGLTVVFGMLGFLNVAHTSFYMLAGYIAYSVAERTGSFWLALLLAPPATVILGLAAERWLFRRLYAAGHTPQLLLTIGIAYVIAEATKMVWGDDALTVAPPPGLRGHLAILGATLPVYHLFVIAITLVLVALLALLIGGTRLGMVVRAAATHPQMVDALGFRVSTVHMLVFLVGLYLAAIAGVVMTPMVGVYPGMADDALVQAFIVVVAGGLGSLSGAFAVAGLLGLVQGFGSVFFSDYALFFPFIVLAGVLLFRPLGLFGARNGA
ncbi:MAG TPA: branched-chain amino acid ABC transporter permease [Acidocella sp.]|jgi:branched-chain amino acid transport system permease protein|uniref:branched-chain amino acid ABC transporter permease n=1 Tax=Acidocella sp. TaxID=50710 RepID=UPI002CD13AF7|nr:branched-chain amino acid ABC transporter permease [Acidocella sp.]HVE21283.1 branched-chain amino acid ABC transporter permease [Acidocella sp.]